MKFIRRFFAIIFYFFAFFFALGFIGTLSQQLWGSAVLGLVMFALCVWVGWKLWKIPTSSYNSGGSDTQVRDSDADIPPKQNVPPAPPKQKASPSSKKVHFDYVDSDGVLTHRDVTVQELDDRYLEGFCHLRGEKRKFRRDRILTGEYSKIAQYVPPDPTVVFLQSKFDLSPDGRRKRVTDESALEILEAGGFMKGNGNAQFFDVYDKHDCYQGSLKTSASVFNEKIERRLNHPDLVVKRVTDRQIHATSQGVYVFLRH